MTYSKAIDNNFIFSICASWVILRWKNFPQNVSKSPQPWLSYRRQCQQTLHPTSAHSDCEQSLQPIDWQGQPAACLPGGSGPNDVYTSGGFMGHVVHLPPIPQHPETPGHKAFRSQLTANELGGIRFAGVGPKWSTVQPRSARAPNSSDNQGLWGSGVDIFPRRSHTYRGRRMPMGVTSNWCHPKGHHARRPLTTVP